MFIKVYNYFGQPFHINVRHISAYNKGDDGKEVHIDMISGESYGLGESIEMFEKKLNEAVNKMEKY